MYSISFTAQYRRCRKLLTRRSYDMQQLDKTVTLLASGTPLPLHYKDHPLKGSFTGERECHVEGLPDWLLVYRKEKNYLVLLLTATGTHSDLFD